MLSFAITSSPFILPVLVFLRKPPTLPKKAKVLAALAVLLDAVVFQVCLSVAVPAASLLPLNTFAVDVTNMDCTREATREVRDFFATMSGVGGVGEVLDFSNLVIIYGGLSRWFTGVAMVVDEAVHLPTSGCGKVSASLFSHELTHVWQVQSGVMFEEGARGFWGWLWEQNTNRAGMYGYVLNEDPDKTFVEYGWEQQASMVNDCFLDWRSNGGVIADKYQLIVDAMVHN
ncbi:hypothetical protein TrCOL_g6636 [Triparma columacea]|uniref:Uncharacterized protein n=1 Tax=Triparma columacea TaxID=722753 RepID=A0A9W7GID3_9STRA|nr:hypothetical protein TrCOL_g6636 [Triparma columacea]